MAREPATHFATYLPSNPEEWRERIELLVAELRRDDLQPGRSHLYSQSEDGPLLACVEGVINEMAIRGGVPGVWAEMEIEDFVATDTVMPQADDAGAKPNLAASSVDGTRNMATLADAADDEPEPPTMTIWEIEPPEGQGAVETTNRAIPEALAYHGFDIQDGQLLIDVMDCDMAFVRDVVNGKHNTSFGTDTLAKLSDRMVGEGVNPLHLTADLLEHLVERPFSSIWHPHIIQWHSTKTAQSPIAQFC